MTTSRSVRTRTSTERLPGGKIRTTRTIVEVTESPSPALLAGRGDRDLGTVFFVAP